MTTYDDDTRTRMEQEENIGQEEQDEQDAARVARWVAAGKPCRAGGEPHLYRDFCGTCAPTATPEELAAFCDRPSLGSGDWTCAHCGGVLCAGGHTHMRNAGEVCPLC